MNLLPQKNIMQEARLSLGWAARTTYIRRQASDFGRRKSDSTANCL